MSIYSYFPKQKKQLVMILTAVIVLLLVVIGVLVWKYQQSNNGGNESAKNQETSKRIIGKVSNLYIVPTSEEPTVALIQDKTKLGNQAFFKKAGNGDYLLIYQKEKIALIYREKDNKLVNVGPVNLDGQNEQQGQTAGDQTQKSTP